MRSWLKLLAYWEIESTVPKEKWGLRLYQSFPEGSKPRQIADQIGMQDLLSVDGYSLVLSAVIAKYRPFLEVAGPAAIDRFLYSGERAKGESFANYIAAKEVARQEVENHLQEPLNDKVAGRVLLRQANLTEFQHELMALRDHSQLLSFDQVASLLRPLDRPALLAQAAGSALGTASTRSYPVMNREEPSNPEGSEHDELHDGDQAEENEASEDDETESSLEEDELIFEDKVMMRTKPCTSRPTTQSTRMFARISETDARNEALSVTQSLPLLRLDPQNLRVNLFLNDDDLLFAEIVEVRAIKQVLQEWFVASPKIWQLARVAAIAKNMVTSPETVL